MLGTLRTTAAGSRSILLGRRCLSTSNLCILDSVAEALDRHQPVVALESTILAHGMPYPHNIQLAREMASILRDRGVEPATIAIQDGTFRIGLHSHELDELAQSNAKKCSTRELALCTKGWGATTVASTMHLARLAGIHTFVTGGIGGVHRGAESTMDVSADLLELSRTPVIVVSAGIKSILDIPKTLEVLETNGVPVVSYRTDDFPSFFSNQSGLKSPARVETPQQIANIYQRARDLELNHGILVAVPNTSPAGERTEAAIQTALLEAEEQNIAGPAVTPYILKRVAELTKGDSLASNIELVKNNARLGAEIAVEVSKVRESSSPSYDSTVNHSVSSPSAKTADKVLDQQSVRKSSSVIVVGGTVLDIVAKPTASLIPRTSNPATIHESDGGVARNIAETIARLGSKPLFYSAVGDDSRGKSLVDRMRALGFAQVDETVAVRASTNTAGYLAVLDHTGDLYTACADMKALEDIPIPSSLILQHAKMVVVDANPPLNTIKTLASRAVELGVPVFFEPTSVPKAQIVAKNTHLLSCFSFVSPNRQELFAMEGISEEHDSELDEEAVAQRLIQRMHPVEAHLLVTRGERGVLFVSKIGNSVTTKEFTANPVNVENATGAGDTLTGAFVHALISGESVPDAIRMGMDAAAMSLRCSNQTISPHLSQ